MVQVLETFAKQIFGPRFCIISCLDTKSECLESITWMEITTFLGIKFLIKRFRFFDDTIIGTWKNTARCKSMFGCIEGVRLTNPCGPWSSKIDCWAANFRNRSNWCHYNFQLPESTWANCRRSKLAPKSIFRFFQIVFNHPRHPSFSKKKPSGKAVTQRSKSSKAIFADLSNFSTPSESLLIRRFLGHCAESPASSWNPRFLRAVFFDFGLFCILS